MSVDLVPLFSRVRFQLSGYKFKRRRKNGTASVHSTLETVTISKLSDIEASELTGPLFTDIICFCHHTFSLSDYS